jgi:hypothetical protein
LLKKYKNTRKRKGNMPKIPGIVYVILGIAMAWFARYVDTRTQNQGMTLFFYAGIVLIAIGVFKIIIKYVTKDETPEKETIISEEEKKIRETIEKRRIIMCKMCGTRHYSTSNYCHMCGTKLK